MAARALYSLLIVQLVLFCTLSLASTPAKKREDAVPSPIVFAASQDWDGNDGPWSSFTIQVGTPPQVLKVFPGTSVYQTIAIIPEGCTSTDPSNCKDLRGGTFSINESSTWEMNTANLSTNIYPIMVDTALGYTGRALLGFDDVTLGWAGAGGPTMKNVTVGGTPSGDSYLGIFGLCARPSNFSSFDNPIPSYMENLRNQSVIPSLSWAYSAGNQYRQNKVLGSLTLGGYDTSKFVNNSLIYSFNEIDIRDLTIELLSITTNVTSTTNTSPTSTATETSLLPTPIPIFLDSALPYLWLPKEACALFESTFNLTWDPYIRLYPINSTQHQTLTTLNPSITFSISNTTNQTLAQDTKISITLPYSAFSLTASSSLTSYTYSNGTAISSVIGNSTYYFPLKRADNSTQYVLGRTFFQEAYVIADYERRNFGVYASKFDDTPQNIVTIYPPSTTTLSQTTNNSTTNTPTNADNIYATGTKHLGIILGAVFGLLICFIALIVIYKRIIIPKRELKGLEKAVEEARWKASTPPMPANAWDDVYGRGAEMDNQDDVRKYEMLGEREIQESDMREREGAEGKGMVFEMDAGGVVAGELETGVRVGGELDSGVGVGGELDGREKGRRDRSASTLLNGSEDSDAGRRRTVTRDNGEERQGRRSKRGPGPGAESDGIVLPGWI